MAKARQKKMRTAYLKKRFGSEMINGGERINTALRKEYQQFSFNPSIPLPDRKTLVKHDPATGGSRTNAQFTQPFAEKLAKHNPGHFGLVPKKEPEWYIITLVDSPLSKYQMFYSGFSDRAAYYFTWLDKISGVTHTSFTLTKSTALRFRENGLKGIIWKD